MQGTPHVTVAINPARLRENIASIRRTVAVPVLAVVKADAYGLGAAGVIDVIDDLVDGYCFFDLAEVRAAGLRDRSRKPAITLGPSEGFDTADFLTAQVRPAVSTVADAERLKEADPILAIDTGQQRFACPEESVDAALRAGGCRSAMTHATRLEQVTKLLDLVGGRGLTLHAAGSSLLQEPTARLDAVRPGVAIYTGAVRVSSPLVDVRDSRGPAGYTGFQVARHGIIRCGYARGLRAGPCLINGRRSRILEVGMQSAFVECAPSDRPGDEVVLLGDGLTESEIAAAWGTGPHVPLIMFAGMRDR